MYTVQNLLCIGSLFLKVASVGFTTRRKNGRPFVFLPRLIEFDPVVLENISNAMWSPPRFGTSNFKIRHDHGIQRDNISFHIPVLSLWTNAISDYCLYCSLIHGIQYKRQPFNCCAHCPHQPTRPHMNYSRWLTSIARQPLSDSTSQHLRKHVAYPLHVGWPTSLAALCRLTIIING